MNKKELINQIAEQTGQSKSDTEKFINAFVDAVKDALKKGDSIALVNFGTFEVVEKSARTSRNPRTGEPIQIPAKKVPRFRPGKGLKDSVL
jgi:DNA-binding protein HU-beta